MRAVHRCTAPVHPHTRGDHGDEQVGLPLGGGSPPHAWGPRAGRCVTCRRTWFTPTRVGTTTVRPLDSAVRPVHPHTRGDHLARGDQGCSPGGSPPHAWGPQTPRTARAKILRFTPTRVGTTLGTDSKRVVLSVHPHTRGDHASSHFSTVIGAGSPPHAWGPRHVQDRAGERFRFTPTRVGTTPPF